jgi:hypothetical protein
VKDSPRRGHRGQARSHKRRSVLERLMQLRQGFKVVLGRE